MILKSATAKMVGNSNCREKAGPLAIRSETTKKALCQFTWNGGQFEKQP
jgi:hypothetical protein